MSSYVRDVIKRSQGRKMGGMPSMAYAPSLGYNPLSVLRAPRSSAPRNVSRAIVLPSRKVVRKGKKYGKKKFRGKKKLQKKDLPRWFKNIARAMQPDRVAGQYSSQVTCAINASTSFTLWKHLSLIDLQNILIASVGNNSSSSVSGDNLKQYLTNLSRMHYIRNNEAYGSAHLQFYCLYPRRDVPTGTGIGTISPPSNNNQTSGGILISPGMYTQAFTDESKFGGGAAKIAQNDTAVTPYMSPTLCALFKIRRYKVQWPDGKRASQGLLLPGQQIDVYNVYRGPMYVSYNKFGLDGSGAGTVTGLWEVLKQTPIIFCVAKGTPSHDSTTKTIVGLGPVTLDIVQDFRYEVWGISNQDTQVLNPITSATGPTSAVQAAEAAGVGGAEGPV